MLALMLVTVPADGQPQADAMMASDCECQECDTCGDGCGGDCGGRRGGCGKFGGKFGGDGIGGCCGPMPQTCYAPRYGCYPGNNRHMHRYPAFHGVYYRRPYNYRNLFDYPWHAELHEPTSLFSYETPDEEEFEDGLDSGFDPGTADDPPRPEYDEIRDSRRRTAVRRASHGSSRIKRIEFEEDRPRASVITQRTYRAR
ncbi:MAG: hypothetical protein DWQ42_07380 [Planctomycetota bacterium]|nr:MAG: hypothetical protein DWQ42_07380 [Planctomycetota bacterium]REK37883.1 MAG: hypothetical protein DWQ46_21730 [Planctomycetota bacterium]